MKTKKQKQTTFHTQQLKLCVIGHDDHGGLSQHERLYDYIYITYPESLLQIPYSLRNTPKTRQTEGNRAEEKAGGADRDVGHPAVEQRKGRAGKAAGAPCPAGSSASSPAPCASTRATREPRSLSKTG